MRSNRRYNVAVLGSYSATVEEAGIAYELGKELAKMDINVMSGGQKGVMLSLCRGVAENRKKTDIKGCLLVGILPYPDFHKANEYVDIVIPAGSGAVQNMVVPLSGDVVVAIGGAAGTLAEISFAWQSGRKIGVIGKAGWAKRLANERLDDRREDTIPSFDSVGDLVGWIKSKLDEKCAAED